MVKLKSTIAFLVVSSLSASFLFAIYQVLLGTMTLSKSIALFVILVPSYLLYSLSGSILLLIFRKTVKQVLVAGIASGFAMFVIFLLVTSPDKAIGPLALTASIVSASFGATLFTLLVMKIIVSPNKEIQATN